jgi:hypothetical protein
MRETDHRGMASLNERAYRDDSGKIDFIVEHKLITRELSRLGLH